MPEPSVCPSCGAALRQGAQECPRCGVIPSKWRGATRERPLPAAAPRPAPPPRPSPAARKATRRAPRFLLLAGIAIAVAAAGVGGWWWVEIRPRMKRLEDPYWGAAPSRGKSIEAKLVRGRPVDLELALPGGPIGMAANGSEIVVANREDPWGFIRLRRTDTREFTVETIPVVEEEYGQKVGFSGVAWNGESYVSTASGSWFAGQPGLRFTVHDARTLRLQRLAPAPPDLGCLTWDGRGYWGATRANTADSGEPRHLYRFDAGFRETARFPSPAAGCQGMAWDGRYLWMVDVFSDEVIVLDPRQDPPSVVERRETPFSYLAGIAFVGDELWLAEYDRNRMHRVSPQLLADWRGGREPGRLLASAAGAPPGRVPAEVSSEEIAELERSLRAEGWGERMRARNRLRELGLPATYDRQQESSPDTGPEEADCLDWWAEMRGDDLYASWRLHFGDALFNSGGEATAGPMTIPLFVRYEISVSGGTLTDEIEREFDVTAPGTLAMDDVLLASNLGAGEYSIGLFIHVQYVRPDGTPHILNQSVVPLSVER